MGKKLAIRGHSTRGKKIIELLEMLGGDNRWKASGEIEKVYYSISNGAILYSPQIVKDTVVFTFDEFYKKYPYKVGDTVYLVNGDEVEIIDMKWEETTGEVLYTYVQDGNNFNIFASYINSKKTENMKIEGTLSLVDGFSMTNPKIEIDLNEYEYKVDDNKLIIQKKNIYPNDYEECVRIAKNIHGYDIHIDVPAYGELMESLVKLLICRDAYWKIAGERMGLSKPWEPDLENEELYCIQNYNKQITISRTNTAFNKILIFPTEEMRDVFYNNFKDLIEQCKTLL